MCDYVLFNWMYYLFDFTLIVFLILGFKEVLFKLVSGFASLFEKIF